MKKQVLFIVPRGTASRLSATALSQPLRTLLADEAVEILDLETALS